MAYNIAIVIVGYGIKILKTKPVLHAIITLVGLLNRLDHLGGTIPAGFTP